MYNMSYQNRSWPLTVFIFPLCKYPVLAKPLNFGYYYILKGDLVSSFHNHIICINQYMVSAIASNPQSQWLTEFFFFFFFFSCWYHSGCSEASSNWRLKDPGCFHLQHVAFQIYGWDNRMSSIKQGFRGFSHRWA